MCIFRLSKMTRDTVNPLLSYCIIDTSGVKHALFICIKKNLFDFIVWFTLKYVN